MTQLILFNLFNGLVIGAFYALMALGLSLILNLSGIINFSGPMRCRSAIASVAGMKIATTPVELITDPSTPTISISSAMSLASLWPP